MLRSYTRATVNWDPIMVSASFTRPNNTTQYAANDAVSDSTSAPSVLTFSSVGSDYGQFITLDKVVITTSIKQSTLPQFNLWLFNAAPTAINDNAAFTLTDAENDTVLCVIPVTTTYTATNNARLENTTFETLIKLASGSKTLYGLLEVTNAYTPGAEEIFKITIGGYRS